ncbi:MAG: hypothetical protein ACLUSP_01375 [Christensenellales bacterium]
MESISRGAEKVVLSTKAATRKTPRQKSRSRRSRPGIITRFIT